MGQHFFSIPHAKPFCPDSLRSAQLVNMTGMPWLGTATLETKSGVDQQLVIQRHAEGSGVLLAPFHSKTYGEVFIKSTTLPERSEPYDLAMELARGALNRLRNQLSIWSEGGLQVPVQTTQRLQEMTDQFASVLFSRHDPTHAANRVATCIDVIERSLAAMFEISHMFAVQVAEFARQSATPSETDVGVLRTLALDTVHEDGFSIPANTHQIAVETEWSPEEVPSKFAMPKGLQSWLTEPGQTHVLGPVVDFGASPLPSWLQASGDDRAARIRLYCQQFAQTYQSEAKIVHAVAGLNGVGLPSFNYPQMLQLATEILETLEYSLIGTSIMVSFDQPFGERLSTASGGVSALEFADTLLRQGTPLAAFGLEVNLDYWPQGTVVRDPFQWVDLIDQWSQFGRPLIIYLAGPSGQATQDTLQHRSYKTIRNPGEDERIADYMASIVELLVSFPAVKIVNWRYAGDQENARFPLSGLHDTTGVAKPLARAFTAMKRPVDLQNRS